MIAVYLRVSSRQQKTDAQKPDIDRWLKGQRIKPADIRWFEDKETGKTLDRPAFEELRTAIFNGEVETVVIWKLDRLSRRQRDGINILADWCEQGVRVVSVTQQLDLSGSVGRIVAGVLFGVAEMELEHVRERQAAGIAAAKERGVYDGLEGRPKGSTKAKPQRAKELAEQGLKVNEIAAAMKLHRNTVRKYLKAG